MNDFLTRLTERTRPGRVVLRPVLPSRFEQVSINEPFWRESIDPFSAADAAPAAARPNLDHGAADMSPSIRAELAVERPRQDPATHVIAPTAKGNLEAGRPFAGSELVLPGREISEATFSVREICPPTNTPPRGSTSSPPGKRRMKPAKPEIVDRSTVREPSIEQRHAATAQADYHQPQPEDRNLPALPPSKPPGELSLIDESRIPTKKGESGPIEPSLKRQLPPEAKSAFLSSHLDPPQPEQGALRPVPAHSTRQRVTRDYSPAEFEPLTSPEIRVTIGRIEVRAIVTQPSGLRPQASRTPQSSLDDYLRSRKEAVA